ncbi:UNVERIFIED_CONTAM: hypothetical protein NCL1_34917 [Trichonephila clavipes]
MPYYDVPTLQESKVWVFENDPMPTMVKSQRAMKKVTYAVFFRSMGLIKAIKLEERTVTENWYTTKCLLEILASDLFSGSSYNLRGRRFHSEDIDGAINAFFHQFQEMKGFKHSICGKFVYKSALMLEETTLNTPKILLYIIKLILKAKVMIYVSHRLLRTKYYSMVTIMQLGTTWKFSVVPAILVVRILVFAKVLLQYQRRVGFSVYDFQYYSISSNYCFPQQSEKVLAVAFSQQKKINEKASKLYKFD